MIDTILKIALEVYKNKDSINKVFNPKYLNYDLNKLKSFYKDECFVGKKIPYVELFNFIESPEIRVNLSILNNDFKLDDINSNEIKAFQINALNEFQQKGKVTHDSFTVRLNSYKLNKNELTIEIQKSKYSDQVQSHLVLDWKNKHFTDLGSATLRGFLIAKYGHKLPPLDEKLLSNSIGISSVIFYRKDNTLLPYLPFRNKSIFSKKRNEPSLFEGIYHCSASGALEWGHGISNFSEIKEDMYREIEEEIGLKKNDLKILECISLTREVLRAGKPQFFFIGYTNLNESQLREKRIEAIRKSKSIEGKVEIQDKHLTLKNEGLEIKNTLISLETIGNIYYCERYFNKYGREHFV